MEKNERLNLVAPCGIDCGICELYFCKDDAQLLDYLVSNGIPKENLPCPGCRPMEGKCPVIPELCKTYECVTDKNVEFCYECNEFPCGKLQPTVDRANILPHNMKVFNLCKMKNIGLEKFAEISIDIKAKYYKGIMSLIGNGPQIQ